MMNDENQFAPAAPSGGEPGGPAATAAPSPQPPPSAPPTYGQQPGSQRPPQAPYGQQPGAQPPLGQQPGAPQPGYGQQAPGYGQPPQPPYSQPPQTPHGQPQAPQTPYGQQQPQSPYGQAPYPQQPGQPGQQPYPQGAAPQQPYGQPPQYGQQPSYGQGQPPYSPQPPQPGQPGQQPGQPGPYGQLSYQPQGGYGQPEPKKKKIWPFVVLGIVVVAIVAVVLLFVLGDGFGGAGRTVSISEDPEAYLAAAMENTAQNIAEAASPFTASATAASDGPVEVEMAVMIRNVDGEPMLSGTTFDLLMQADPQSREMLMEMGFGYGPVKLSGNQIYISDDITAVSIPALYSRYRYITVNNATFTSDWNRSELGSYGSALPNRFNLQDEISAMFDAMQMDSGAANPAVGLLAEKLEVFSDELFENGDFANEGREDVTVNGESMTLDVLSYTFSAEETKELYDNFVDIMDAYMQDSISQYSDFYSALGLYNNPYQNMLYEWSYAVDEIKQIHFPQGMKLSYYVNSDLLINRVEVSGLTIAYANDPDQITGGLVLHLSGDDSVGDNMSMDMWLRSPYNDEIRIVLDQTTTVSGSSTTREGRMRFLEDNSEEFFLSYNLSWDDADGGEVYFAVEMGDDWTTMGMVLGGSIHDSRDEYSIQNGSFDFYLDNRNILGVDFSYAARPISGVDIDLDDSVNFFDLDMDQFGEDLMAGVMGMAGSFY